ncbi:hypothetical protein Ahy_B07g087062 isoform B [Arachis hypogaea]|uniref:Protein FAR1-RELATED SEQUENCE n=1 Tax=Arachis hypogaea TaxID=3818 RepID=A0A444YB89_ARAHY|nr:hypothetical protein Ahy_B07g087062 isoform B [Arachis hypogaea]
MMNYFMRMKDINPNFFFAVNFDEKCKFRSALWVDARCRASHALPFASFVGVNHHGKSTLLGCALLGNKKTPSYEWIFSQWVKYMGNSPQGESCDPRRWWKVRIPFLDPPGIVKSPPARWWEVRILSFIPPGIQERTSWVEAMVVVSPYLLQVG